MLCYCDIMHHCNGNRTACLGGDVLGVLWFFFFFLKSCGSLLCIGAEYGILYC